MSDLSDQDESKNELINEHLLPEKDCSSVIGIFKMKTQDLMIVPPLPHRTVVT